LYAVCAIDEDGAFAAAGRMRIEWHIPLTPALFRRGLATKHNQ